VTTAAAQAELLEHSPALHRIGTSRLVPVVVVDDPPSARPLADALVDGGLPVAEVTFRTSGAAAALQQMAANPDVCVGAGTVLTAEQVDAAVDAGAQFVVSPGLSRQVVRRCTERGVPAIPGVATATEVTHALALGVGVAKLFPAAQLGGVSMVRALAGPFPQMRFIPTGGVSADSAADYLAQRSVLAVGGSWMVPADLLRRGDFDQVAALTRQAVAAVDDEKDAHE
jgi:2-dehydro-3-deoxyphosphogluconate aldolase / (4S)-4-hydroxy-2-oxoglutarate aldolase